MYIYNENVRKAKITVRDYINQYYNKHGYGYPLIFIGTFRNTIVYGNNYYYPYCRQGSSAFLPFVINGVNIKLHTCMYKK